MKFTTSILLVCLLVLSSCGGGGSDSPSTLTGVFIDSPVINIGYRTATQNGETNSRGEFKYLAGETVTFFIGALEFPPVLAAEVVTPLDMADTDDVAHHMVVNIIRLLQSLDKDGDPDNGITITQTAKDNAVFLDFDLSVESFESQAGVTLFIGNAGQDVTLTDLVDTVLAMVHFVASLVLAGEIESEAEPVNNDSLVGTWEIASPTESDLFLLSLFEDGTYVHAEVNETTSNFLSGMEWGTYNVVGLGEVTASHILDNNGDAGLSAFDGSGPRLRIIAQPSGSLMYSSDINNDGISDNTFGLRRVDSDGILGTWLSTTTENDLLMIVFFDDGTYFHGEVDEDDDTEISGMELGTYAHDESTGLLTVTQTFDNNGSAGLTDFVGVGAPNIFVEVSGDTLTATIDEDGDELIDETIIFQRQHL
ncbi:MAG: hypothetical protein ACPHW1_00915 [Porticoccaceae bacterium]